MRREEEGVGVDGGFLDVASLQGELSCSPARDRHWWCRRVQNVTVWMEGDYRPDIGPVLQTAKQSTLTD